MMSEIRPGMEVTKGSRRGVVTEPVKKSGIWKGRVSVMWIGAPYTYAEWPEDLTVIPDTSF